MGRYYDKTEMKKFILRSSDRVMETCHLVLCGFLTCIVYLKVTAYVGVLCSVWRCPGKIAVPGIASAAAQGQVQAMTLPERREMKAWHARRSSCLYQHFTELCRIKTNNVAVYL
jgi:hypothetical protein